MSIATLVRLLGFGFSGVAVILALLSFKLLQAEQKKKSPNANVLRRIDQFGKRAIVIAALVGIVQVTEIVVRRLTFGLPAPPAEIASCRDSLSFLSTQKDLASPEAMRAAVYRHDLACNDLLRRLDREAGN